jgi:hypothetical protein
MTADPHVTRLTNSRRSAYQYQHFADDESSDSASAPGFSDGFGIQGTFPSTERIRVRWAAPVRKIQIGIREGRRRVGVTDVRGEMLCTVFGHGRESATRLLEKKACWYTWITKGPVRVFRIPAFLPFSVWV